MMDSAVRFTMIILRLNVFQKFQMSKTITRSLEELVFPVLQIIYVKLYGGHTHREIVHALCCFQVYAETI